MASSPQLALAMDWGGTWVRTAVADRRGELLWSARRRNDKGGRKQLVAVAEDLLQQALDWCAGRPVAGIGVAIAGPVDVDSGTLYQPPNLPDLDGFSVKEEWEARLGSPVFVGNDANLAALGEYHYGAGREAREAGASVNSLVYVTVSTGVGGGVVERGRMLLGAHGMAAEVGHMTLDYSDKAPPCQCGNTGCLESLASGTAIARAARELLTQHGAQSSLSSHDPDSLTAELVVEAAIAGDALARRVLDDAVLALSVGLTNLLHLFNPDLIVLGGGVTGGLAQAGMLERIKQEMRKLAMSDRHRDFRLLTSKLGDSVGMVGAAGLVWKETGLWQPAG